MKLRMPIVTFTRNRGLYRLGLEYLPSCETLFIDLIFWQIEIDFMFRHRHRR